MSPAQPRPASLLLRVCAAAAVAAWPLAQGAPQRPAGDASPPAFASLGQHIEDAGGLDPEGLLDTLVASGPRAVADLRELLSGEDPDGGVDFSPAQRELLRRSLERIPAWVTDHVDRSTQAGPRDLARLKVALDVLVKDETEDACARTLALASPRDREQPAHAVALREVQEALRERLQRVPRDARRLEELVDDAAPQLVLLMVRAAGQAPSSDAAEFLTNRLEESEGLDLVLLAELGRVLSVLQEPADPIVEQRVAWLLESADPAMRREASLAAGRLELRESTGRLIDLLEDEDASVRANAAWSLQRITARRDKGDADRWRRWYAAEVGWWSDGAQQAFTTLRGSDLRQVGAALRELAGHRLYRHQIAEVVVGLLVREEPWLVQLACATLGSLRSGLAVAPLRALLDHEDEGVRKAAAEALGNLETRPRR
ncbi:MAG: HEAT repeat domain-containing protein [Planctomycetes bacterium]|nr:HEAT repeat domain-containing protein [Planctomycetota bacterium]